MISKRPCYINDFMLLRVLFVNNVQERLRSLYLIIKLSLDDVG